MNIQIAKAAPVGSQETPDVTITIGPEIPPNVTPANYFEIYRRFYESQARAIFEGLQSLPGGTLDRLLVVLLEHKVSILRVPMFDREAKAAPMPEFPLVLQTVLYAAEHENGIHFNYKDTAALAAEIRKLLDGAK